MHIEIKVDIFKKMINHENYTKNMTTKIRKS